jgi:hypothetical protein
MRLLIGLTTLAFLGLGLGGVAQAGNGGLGCGQEEFAVLECKSTKKGGFEAFAFSNDGGHAPAIEVGDDCADALNALRNESDGTDDEFFVREVSTGTPDKTIYTMRARGSC